MTREELIEKIIATAMEEFSNMDQSDADSAYKNVLTDYLKKCSDKDLSDNFDYSTETV